MKIEVRSHKIDRSVRDYEYDTKNYDSKERYSLLERARTLALAMWRPNLPAFPQTPRLLATRIDNTIFCLVPSIAASQARRSSPSSALDFAIWSLCWLCNACLAPAQLMRFRREHSLPPRWERKRDQCLSVHNYLIVLYCSKYHALFMSFWVLVFYISDL